ncbi:hypothetical protein VP01_10749g1 [Puccinia sorghi]|uniref:Uncharacterized protein n=1 Tax=Puccinia sorghi TaxID=27349 RepID=A0A0L6VTJ6_9BASI|nr:hypothetical protein VP01_10749g1 [Puccinia sorghi]
MKSKSCLLLNIVSPKNLLKSAPERLRIQEISKNHSSRLFNPFLKLKSFDGCQDTPVEVLHVFLLGIVN